jgi:hypothetical protein
MISWDKVNKQILSHECIRCPDEYFSPNNEGLPKVGCCSYSPVFTLFEIYKMVKEGDRQFFIDHIYNHEQNTVKEYEIVVHARINPLYFSHIEGKALTVIEEEDAKAAFSVCDFFVPSKGCGLDSHYKNSTCRSFICSTIEERLAPSEQDSLVNWVKEIRQESESFHSVHKSQLQRKKWNLKQDRDCILDYLTALL